MSSKKRELYDLVHSLSKEEVRAFTRSLKNESGTAYGQIFEVILAQNSFNDKLLNTNLQKILSGNKLAQSKRYLKRKLIVHLGQAYESGDKNSKTYNYYLRGLSLFQRGHFELGMRTLEKGIQYAHSNELLIPLLHGSFHKWDALTTAEPIPDNIAKAEKQYNDAMETITKLKLTLSVHHIFWKAETGLYGIKEVDFKELWTALELILNSKEFIAATIRTVKLHLDALSCASAIQYGLGDYLSSLEYSNRILKLCEKEEDKERVGIRRRVIYFVNHLMILGKVPQRKVARAVLNKTETQLNKLDAATFRRSIGLIIHFYAQYLGYMNAQLELNVEVARDSYKKLKVHITRLKGGNVIRFALQSSIHFILAELPKEALDITGIVLKRSYKNRDDKYWMVRIIDTICHFLLNDFEYVLSSTPSLLRNLKKNFAGHELEVTYLKYIHRLCMGAKETQPLLLELKKMLEALPALENSLHIYINQEIKKADHRPASNLG